MKKLNNSGCGKLIIQTVISIPGPSNTYYIFYQNAINCSPNKIIGLSIVDMNLKNGLGDVTLADSLIYFPKTIDYKLTGTRHSNGRDFWIITQALCNTTNEVYALLVTPNGPTKTIVTTVLPPPPFDQINGSSCGNSTNLKASNNGEKLVSHFFSYTSLMDFNPATGKASNPIWHDMRPPSVDNTNCMGIGFAPGDSILYISCTRPQGMSYHHGLYQFRLNVPDPFATKYLIPGTDAYPLASGNGNGISYGGIQIAPDGKMYVAKPSGSFGSSSGFTKMGVIQNPNGIGAACNYTTNGPALPDKWPKIPYPSFALPHYLDALLIAPNYFGCGPLTVNFKNPLPGATSYAWVFPDNTTSTSPTPTYTFTQSGQHVVLLKVGLPSGGFDSSQVLVEVYDNPKKFYRLLSDTVCKNTPTTLSFDTLGSNMRMRLYYNGLKLLPNLQEKYILTFGTNRTVWVASENTLTGCTDSSAYTITVGDSVNKSFTISPTTACIGQSIQLSATDTTNSKYAWYANGQLVGNGRTLNTNFLTSGVYTIKLVAFKNGCTDSLTKTNALTVKNPPKALVGKFSNQFCQWVNFTLKDSCRFTDSVIINWGDGTTQRLKSIPNQLISHTFTQSGTFAIVLIAQSGQCTDTLQLPLPLTIIPAPKPGFALSDSIGCNPKTITLTNQSIGLVDSMFIDWGNGPATKLGTPTQNQQFLQTYINVNNYTVIQTLKGPTGCITTAQKAVNIIPKAAAAYQLTDSATCGKVHVTLQNRSQFADSVLINWGDGSATQVYKHTANAKYTQTFAQNGIFSITLTAKNAYCSTDTFTAKTIQITAPPSSDFTLSDSTGCAPKNITLTGNNQGLIDSVFVFWGDNTADTAKTAAINAQFTHTYATANTYTVTQILKGITGCMAQKSKTLNLASPIVLQTSWSRISGCKPLQTEVKIQASTAQKATINWGDGTPNFSRNMGGVPLLLSHSYATDGVYSAIIVAQNAFCSDTSTQTITISSFDANTQVEIIRTTVEGKTLTTYWKTEPNALTYQIEKSADNTAWMNIGSQAQSPYTDAQVSPSKRQTFYRISAIDSCGNTSGSKNIGSNIVLNSSIIGNYEAAQLNWTSYTYWPNTTAFYEVHRAPMENENAWQLHSVTNQTQFADQDFFAPEHQGWCYKITAKGTSAEQFSQSNTVCEAFKPQVFVPTAFSPNTDNLNDRFEVKSIGIKSISYKIYDRWGELVFESSATTPQWDGTHAKTNEVVKAGMYVLVLEATPFSGSAIVQRQSLAVVR